MLLLLQQPLYVFDYCEAEAGEKCRSCYLINLIILETRSILHIIFLFFFNQNYVIYRFRYL